MKVLLVVFALLWSSLLWAQQAGKVDFVEGNVRLQDAANKEKSLKLGDPVSEGETVITGSDGEVHLAMEDGGQLGIRPNSRLRVLSYKAEGSKEDRSIFNLLQGAMRSVTGWIGKYNPKSYEIRTPTATIGVRGTDHETRVIPQGSSEGEPGTYDKVNAGATQIRTAYGRTDVRPNQAGFVAFASRARPRVLERVPTFFHPMRNDKRFDGLHEKIRQRLPEQRAARIHQLQERRQLSPAPKMLQRQEAHGRKSETRRFEREQHRQRLEQRRSERPAKMLEKHPERTQEKPGKKLVAPSVGDHKNQPLFRDRHVPKVERKHHPMH